MIMQFFVPTVPPYLYTPANWGRVYLPRNVSKTKYNKQIKSKICPSTSPYKQPPLTLSALTGSHHSATHQKSLAQNVTQALVRAELPLENFFGTFIHFLFIAYL